MSREHVIGGNVSFLLVNGPYESRYHELANGVSHVTRFEMEAFIAST